MHRCLELADQFETGGRRPADLDAAVAEFDRIPTTDPERPATAIELVRVQVRTAMLQTPAQADRVERLAAIGDTARAQPAGWAADRAAVRAMWLLYGLDQGTQDPDAALGELERLVERVPQSHPFRTAVQAGRFGALFLRAQQAGDIVGMDRLATEIAAFRQNLLTGTPVAVNAEFMHTVLLAMVAWQRRDLPEMDAQIDRIAHLLADGPVTSAEHLQQQMDEGLNSLRAMRRALDTGSLPDTAEHPIQREVERLQRLADQPGTTAGDRAYYLAQLGGIQLGAGPTYFEAAIAAFTEAARIAPAADPRRQFALMSWGTALLTRYEHSRRPGDLVESTRILEQARDLAADPSSPYWAAICQPLAMTYRHAGRREMGGRTARDALRGHAWSVLLQSRTGAATAAAVNAADDAIDIARWSLEDGDPAGAALALDAGRGLALQAATRIGSVVTQLIDVGEQALARRWEHATARAASPDEVDINLRKEVMHALIGDGAGLALSPPDHDQVRAALRVLGADALVYLLSPERGLGGAVVVPASSEPQWLRLPELAYTPGSAPARFLDWVDGREGTGLRTLKRDLVRPARADPLPDVCDWAWTAAVGPLLDRLPRRRGLRSPLPPRVVLVPMGELGRIPWHAARRLQDGRTRYAIEDAVFSYAVSAGALCASAALDELPIGDAGLVIADPRNDESPDLPGARLEASAIRGHCYPGARYLGRNPDGTPAAQGPGGRAAVERWLGRAGPYHGTVVHAACHGVVQARRDEGDSSYLLLHDGDRLTAEALIRALTSGRRLGLALAVLSACSSNVPGRGYDEALSIASAFLAGGTRAVVSSQWPVPDLETSALMFVFHRELRAGRPPADALRAAQLWMLDPDPTTLPPEVASRLAGMGPVGISAWAAFIHMGRIAGTAGTIGSKH